MSSAILRTRRLLSEAATLDNTQTFQLPRDKYHRGLWLRITGNLVVTVLATLHEDGILNLIRRIELLANGKDVIKSLSGYNLGQINRDYFSTAPMVSEPAVGVATNAFEVLLHLPFQMIEEDLRGSLDPRNLTGYDLNIQWGTVSNVITAGTATLTNVTLRVEADETEPGMGLDAMTEFWVRHTTIRKAFTQSGETEIDLPIGNTYRGFLIVVREGATLARSNAPLDETLVELVENGTEKHRSYLADTLRGRNQLMNQGALPTGVYLLKLDENDTYAGHVNTAGMSSFKIVLTPAAPSGANGEILVVPISIIYAKRS